MPHLMPTRRTLAFGSCGRGSSLVLALVAFSTGCQETRPLGPGNNAAMAGSVTRQKTGAGVPGVVVALLANDELTATTHTDAAGQFDFGRVGAGTYTVRITGFEIAGIDPRFDAPEPSSRIVTVGQGSSDLVFTIVGLVPPRITGEVRCGGSAVEGARVRVIGGEADVTVVTNALGRYAALNLMPGHYAVIPIESPCVTMPSHHAVELLPGQSGQADFVG